MTQCTEAQHTDTSYITMALKKVCNVRQVGGMAEWSSTLPLKHEVRVRFPLGLAVVSLSKILND